ncbi:hypothetical protein OQZ33_04305 [Pedobacter sp. MC2016-05]|uniref:hypothetical protein n=1 Tax=Pedobacter sp. MC2016-05 TaxID=2994474 RepID=UPI00224566EE|nr:hypothetical protein [Pedobacter sp. MC2016-05]MCX2473548.1 hypothetical protein [Pedobacter sp. MC2016-05]
MTTDTITFQVTQANSIDPFLFDGKRNMHFHFFVKTASGWDFRWVDQDLTREWLEQKIEEGVIYIFDDES